MQEAKNYKDQIWKAFSIDNSQGSFTCKVCQITEKEGSDLLNEMDQHVYSLDHLFELHKSFSNKFDNMSNYQPNLNLSKSHISISIDRKTDKQEKELLTKQHLEIMIQYFEQIKHQYSGLGKRIKETLKDMYTYLNDKSFTFFTKATILEYFKVNAVVSTYEVLQFLKCSLNFQLSDQENAILEKQGKLLEENLTEDSQSICVKYKFLKQFLNDIKQGEEQDLYLAFLIVIFFKVSIKDLIKLTYQRLITEDGLKIHFKGDNQNIFHSVDDILKEVKLIAQLELKQHNYKTMNDTIFMNQSERDIRRLVKKVILSLEEKNQDNQQYLDFISFMNLKNASNLLKLKKSTDNNSKIGQINNFHQQLIPLSQNNHSFMNLQKQDDYDFNQSWSISEIPREIQVGKQSKKTQSQQEKIQPFICLQGNQCQEEIIIIDDDVSKDLSSSSKLISQKIKQGKRQVNEKQIYNFSSQDLIKKQIKPNIKASIQNSDHQVYQEKPKKQQKQNESGKIVNTQDVETQSQVIN